MAKEVSAIAESRRELAEFFARIILVCGCRRELRIERGNVHCAGCHALVRWR